MHCDDNLRKRQSQGLPYFIQLISGRFYNVIRATRKETELWVIFIKEREHTQTLTRGFDIVPRRQKTKCFRRAAAFLNIVTESDRAENQKSEFRFQL